MLQAKWFTTVLKLWLMHRFIQCILYLYKCMLESVYMYLYNSKWVHCSSLTLHTVIQTHTYTNTITLSQRPPALAPAMRGSPLLSPAVKNSSLNWRQSMMRRWPDWQRDRVWWRQREIGSRGRRRNGEYEVETGGGGAGQGGHPARDEQSYVVGRKR